MKFGNLLANAELPEWKGEYFRYRYFKNKLEAVANALSGASRTRSGSLGSAAAATTAAAGPSSSAPASTPFLPIGGGASSSTATSDINGGDSSQKKLLAAQWREEVQSEVRRISDRVHRDLHELRAQLEDLLALSQKLAQEAEAAAAEAGSSASPTAPTEDDVTRGTSTSSLPSTRRKPHGGSTRQDFAVMRILGGLNQLHESLERLRDFKDWNQAATFKIFKKHDKLLGSREGLTVHYPNTLTDTRLRSAGFAIDALDGDLKRALEHQSGAAGVEHCPDVLRLAAGLTAVSNAHNERKLFFALGFLVAMVVAIMVLILLPAKDPSTFVSSYFLASLSVFRLVIATAFVFWGCGGVAYFCNSYAINHMFILDVDPRCRVGPEFLFRQAAWLSCLWIFVYGAYVLDYKWEVLPMIWSTAETARTSFHYMLYPTILLFLTIVMIIIPSKVCRYRYRRQLLGAIGRTCLAPLYAVSFGDNLVGDVMTSLAKPLQDVPSAWCYIFSPHPQTQKQVDLFKKYGTTCPQGPDIWHPTWYTILRPIISALPFVFRLMQCARRYRDTREPKHLLNFGKYFASLMVVVVSTFRSSDSQAVIVITIIATIYAWTWDVTMDWGLGYQELCRPARSTPPDVSSLRTPISRPMETILSFAGGNDEEGGEAPPAGRVAGFAPSGEGAELATTSPQAQGVNSQSPTSGAEAVRQWHAHEQVKRRFGRRFYWTAVIFDMLGRLTWVVTLLPISIISDNVVQRAAVEMSITITEIFRRSLWSVIRIEYEQASNASGFRALLWVPMLMKGD